MTRHPRRGLAAVLTTGLAAGLLSFAGTASTAAEAPGVPEEVAYSRVADPILETTPSWSGYSHGYSSFGNTVTLVEGTGRVLSGFDFVLANWSCQEGVSGSATTHCLTEDPEATFDVDVTITFYSWDHSGESPVVGAVVAERTETVTLPYRPSQDAEQCERGAWFDEGIDACRNDQKHLVTIGDFEDVLLPDDVIVGIGIDTSEPGPHRAVNVGLDEIETPALVGSDLFSVGWPVAGGSNLWSTYYKLQFEVRTTTTFKDVPGSHAFYRQIEWLGVEGLSTGFSDGNFRPAAAISREATSAFIARWLSGGELPACAEAPFTDVPIGHAFCAEIQWMKEEGLAEGYEGGTFLPVRSMSRQAGAAFLARAVDAELEACTEAPFTDVPVDHGFCSEIQWMKDAGVAVGYDDGTFRPTEPMSRQAMAAWVHASEGLRAG